MMRVLNMIFLSLVVVILSGFFQPTNLTANPPAYTDIGDYDDRVISLVVDQGTLIRVSKPASAVFVADPNIADVQVKTPHLIYVFGRAPGITSLYAVDDKETVLMNRQIAVQFEIHRLKQAIEDMLPHAKIELQALNKTVVLRGDVKNASDAADAVAFANRFIGEGHSVVNQLRITGSNQVNLQVTIAEMSKNTLKEIGVNWDAASSIGSFVFGLATGNPAVIGNSFVTRANGTNNIGIGYRGGRHSVNALIDALEEEGLIKVMAKPNLTALSGETASFLSGGEFPVPVAQENDRITVEFREFGVSLAFTPTILGDNRISLKVRPEVSQLTNTGAFNNGTLSIPALSTRRAETTIEMGSGQSFAIAGLIQQRSTQDNDSVPGLNKAPVVSALFQSDTLRKEETELVIIVTPYVVEPTNKRLSTPIDGHVPPTDSQRYINRQMYQRHEGKPNAVGAAGFQLQ